MNDALAIALVAAAIVFALMVLVPVASFLLRAAVVAGLAGLAVYLVARLLGR
ncbi:hypothetical protein [Rhodovulum sp. 12E13]|uniref:hypothetical protein n=1 Tax=Rhodovulum sp. 12E13 TaxID=2203891 RepID=UPI001314CFE6|nr:hypothetical protein [Rhodovulum sp. 12E13]